jgi:O-acetyl-ADP-ribose deacetylase (regulator of RNase III)
VAATKPERVKVIVGDITRLTVDAIVNAANEAMRGGGGVDGAIHRAAGPGLLEECIKVGRCPTGQARITGGHLLAAKFVLHTVGPVWHGGSAGEPDLLASCYQRSLALAEEHGVTTIAFPCISTGVYGYPIAKACDIAVECVLGWLDQHELPQQVVFCCFADGDAEVYRRRFGVTNS